ncbi:orotate phosphoribosyltransferase [Desulfoscipio gibsoniae]|uniref:Orotate phosphoribosyltransferase n=1 Tax=Desulfoscipio gibsoniae DSM 7213 TaxID=767817 RepID=R4KUR1_9FIRM|nr:orotate phosphoribosyltransferase [Desulfoscipio gibsoniae]AGL03356.1 orotate phosphoribosyltransferase [Desulfoscipio gibsoniae DSM 7213]
MCEINNREALKELLDSQAFERRPVVLSSGKTSHYYFDGRKVSLSPRGAYLIAQIICDMLEGENVEAVGGLTMGADPIVGALGPEAYRRGLDLSLFIVRKEAKKHGTKQQIEGPPLKPGQRVVIVDDVITTGGSVIKAVQAVRELGCEVVKAIVLVDRQEGGTQNLEEMGVKVEPVFTAADFGL